MNNNNSYQTAITIITDHVRYWICLLNLLKQYYSFPFTSFDMSDRNQETIHGIYFVSTLTQIKSVEKV